MISTFSKTFLKSRGKCLPDPLLTPMDLTKLTVAALSDYFLMSGETECQVQGNCERRSEEAGTDQ